VRRLSNARGSILLMTLLFMATLVVFASTFLDMAGVTNRNAEKQKSNLKALYIAEAGLNKAIWYLLDGAPDGSVDGSWRTLDYPDPCNNDPCAPATSNDPLQEQLGPAGDRGTYRVWIETDSGNPSYIVITSMGEFRNIRRTIQQKYILTDDGAGDVISAEPVALTWKELLSEYD
jgi:hypothetical protein